LQVGLHDVKSAEMQNERIDLPDNPEDMQLLLLTYREDLVSLLLQNFVSLPVTLT
jgi:hypothetical protein